MILQTAPLSKRCFWIQPEAEAIGVKFLVAEIHGVKVTRQLAELEEEKRRVAHKMKGLDPYNQPILLAYRRLLDSVGATSEVASPEFLLRLVIRNGRLPTINSVVDAYNTASLETLIVASAHDLEKVEGNPGISMMTGTEVFYPLGSSSPTVLPEGQWAGVADNHVLCQLNCKQSDLSKVTLETKNLLIYVQGNDYTTHDYLESALEQVCEALVRFNGGSIWRVTRCN